MEKPWAGQDNWPLKDDHRQNILNEIGTKWPRFTKQELKSLTTNDQLISQIVDKYGIGEDAAQREVDTLMNGRNLNGWGP